MEISPSTPYTRVEKKMHDIERSPLFHVSAMPLINIYPQNHHCKKLSPQKRERLIPIPVLVDLFMYVDVFGNDL